jgi:hypothetical protein
MDNVFKGPKASMAKVEALTNFFASFVLAQPEPQETITLTENGIGFSFPVIKSEDIPDESWQ